jgi:hypothetical protein
VLQKLDVSPRSCTKKVSSQRGITFGTGENAHHIGFTAGVGVIHTGRSGRANSDRSISGKFA